MNLNEKTTALLEGLAEDRSVDWYSLQEADHPESIMRVTDAIRRWLGIPGSTGGVRPGPEILAPLFGFGQAGLLRVFEAFCSETLRTEEEAGQVFAALRTLAGHAKAMRLTNWNLNGVTPEAAKGRPKILVAFPAEVDERMRATAQARGETLTGFVVEAVRDRLAAIERPRRAATATAAAGQ